KRDLAYTARHDLAFVTDLGVEMPSDVDGTARHQLRVLRDGTEHLELRSLQEHTRLGRLIVGGRNPLADWNVIDDAPDDAVPRKATVTARGHFETSLEITERCVA